MALQIISAFRMLPATHSRRKKTHPIWPNLLKWAHRCAFCLKRSFLRTQGISPKSAASRFDPALPLTSDCQRVLIRTRRMCVVGTEQYPSAGD